MEKLNKPLSIKVHQDPESGECYFQLEDFKDLIDVSKVDCVEMKTLNDKSLILTFFDKDKNQISSKN